MFSIMFSVSLNLSFIIYLGIYFINQEDLSNGGQEEEFKDSDFLRPKGSAKKSQKYFILNGFMELKTFM